jgi:uncharacterized protein YraI
MGRVVLALVLFAVATTLVYFAWQSRSQLTNLFAPAEALADEAIAGSRTPAPAEATSTPLFTELLAVPSAVPTRTPMNTATVTPSPTPTYTATPTRTPTATATTTVIPSATSTVVANVASAVIIVERANVRSGPGPDYNVVGVAARDQQLAITGRTNAGDWWQVCCLGINQSGWLFGELVTISGDVSAVPVVLAPPPESTSTPVAP